MEFPSDMKYTADHEWVRLEGDVATVGITAHAAGELGDIVFVDAPDAGKAVSKGDTFGTIESVKTVADLFAPMSGEICEVNDELASAPETVNSYPYGAGWIVKIKVSDPSEADSLISAEDYQAKL